MRIRQIVPTVLVVAGVAFTTTQAGATMPSKYHPNIDPSAFTNTITNKYLPLVPGATFVYEGTEDARPQENIVTVTSEAKTIMGVPVVVVHDVVNENGSPIEDTFDWYAQDAKGNVWYFGEDSKTLDHGKVKGTKGSWEAGVKGAQPGIVMPAHPKAGASYRQEYLRGEAEDSARVVRLGATTTALSGQYDHVLVIDEFTRLEPGVVERKYYAPGVGLVVGDIVKGGKEHTELKSVQTG
jgi:hypothetical protein